MRSNPVISTDEHLLKYSYRRPSTVAVAIISHNYGRFLAECVESVLAQTHRAAEIVVVDDASSDETGEVAQSFSDRGVRSLRVDFQNVHQTRKAGFDITKSEVLCFLDADDRLAADYIEKGLKEFVSDRVAVVYSDVEYFGTRKGRFSHPDTYDPDRLQYDNYLHAGSLARREALRLSGVFDRSFDPLYAQGDWFLWRQVLMENWTARKQAGLYLYRKHPANWNLRMKKLRPAKHYFEYAALRQQDVTLFLPLSGRFEGWPRLVEFLERQTWPHDQIRLVLMDTSQNDRFGKLVRSWIARCDYSDVRHFHYDVGVPGLADVDRRDTQVRTQVVTAMQRIYNRMINVVETEYVWILEDDITPPQDVCQRLLEGFDAQTASVAAPYRSRYHTDYVVWNWAGRAYSEPGTGLADVGGNGFGCTILRRSVLRKQVFVPIADVVDYDTAFYRRLQASPLVAKVDWSCCCQHLEGIQPQRQNRTQAEGQ